MGPADVLRYSKQLVLQGVQGDRIQYAVRWVVVAEVQISARAADERVVVIVIEHGDTRFEQASGSRECRNPRTKAVGGGPDCHHGVERADIAVVDRNAADEY